MKKTCKQIPAPEAARYTVMFAGLRPEGEGHAVGRRPPRSGGEPGSGCGQRASRRGHVPRPALGTTGWRRLQQRPPVRAAARPASGPPSLCWAPRAGTRPRPPSSRGGPPYGSPGLRRARPGVFLYIW